MGGDIGRVRGGLAMPSILPDFGTNVKDRTWGENERSLREDREMEVVCAVGSMPCSRALQPRVKHSAGGSNALPVAQRPRASPRGYSMMPDNVNICLPANLHPVAGRKI